MVFYSRVKVNDKLGWTLSSHSWRSLLM